MQKTGQIDQEMTATNQPINQPYNGISYTSVLPQPTSLGITNTSVMQGKSGDKQGGTPWNGKMTQPQEPDLVIKINTSMLQSAGVREKVAFDQIENKNHINFWNSFCSDHICRRYLRWRTAQLWIGWEGPASQYWATRGIQLWPGEKRVTISITSLDKKSKTIQSTAEWQLHSKGNHVKLGNLQSG